MSDELDVGSGAPSAITLNSVALRIYCVPTAVLSLSQSKSFSTAADDRGKAVVTCSFT